MTAISISELTKTFGNHKALDNVSLNIGQGEMVALIGASGSGKSTLIRHVAGLEIADRRLGKAQVEILGKTIQLGGRLAKNARLLRRDIGVIFQQFNLVPRLSLLTNVLMGCLGRVHAAKGCFGFFGKEERRSAQECLERVGIAKMAKQRASTLSGGQQQRGAIARTLLQRAKLILADEPIASLDPASSKQIMEALAEINSRDGITVVVSLHQVDYAVRYCRRAIALHNGSVIFDGASSELTPDFLRTLYGAESEELIGIDSVMEAHI